MEYFGRFLEKLFQLVFKSARFFDVLWSSKLVISPVVGIIDGIEDATTKSVILVVNVSVGIAGFISFVRAWLWNIIIVRVEIIWRILVFVNN